MDSEKENKTKQKRTGINLPLLHKLASSWYFLYYKINATHVCICRQCIIKIMLRKTQTSYGDVTFEYNIYYVCSTFALADEDK